MGRAWGQSDILWEIGAQDVQDPGVGAGVGCAYIDYHLTAVGNDVMLGAGMDLSDGEMDVTERR